MTTWPNRGASGGPCGGLEDNEIKQSIEVRPRRSDSSQQASSIPGAIQSVLPCRNRRRRSRRIGKRQLDFPRRYRVAGKPYVYAATRAVVSRSAGLLPAVAQWHMDRLGLKLLIERG